MARFKKADITQRYYRGRVPCVNVKIDYCTDPQLDAIARRVAIDHGAPADPPSPFTLAWVRAELSDRDQDFWYGEAVRDAWEQLTEDVNSHEIFPWQVKIYSEGRSGGWAVVDGIIDRWGEVETWDAIKVMRWGKFAKWARQTADDVMYQYFSLIWLNVYSDDGAEPEVQTWQGAD